MTQYRTCCICKETKNLEMFYKDKTASQGRDYRCIVCRRISCKIQKRKKTENIYQELFLKQSGLCAICGKTENIKKRLCVDHCHKTGKIRGLLCDDCNTSIGKFKDSIDNLKKAIKYLEDNVAGIA